MKIKSLYRRILKNDKIHLIERIYTLAHTKRTGNRVLFNELISERG